MISTNVDDIRRITCMLIGAKQLGPVGFTRGTNAFRRISIMDMILFCHGS